MSRMSIPQLIKAFNGIPRREEVANALASTRAYQNHGHIEYDVARAGAAMIAYYQRMENSAMVRHNRRKKKESTFSLEIANRFRERAKAIEARLKELMEDYACSDAYTGTLWARLTRDGIFDTAFFADMDIDQTIKYLESGREKVLFWVMWVLLIVGIVVGFYHFENRWLED